MNLAFMVAGTEKARSVYESISKGIPVVETEDADVIVALGGDGFMLHALHTYPSKKIYGINCGTTGFLLNGYPKKPLIEKIKEAEETILNPLSMNARTMNGDTFCYLAINEVALLRETRQAAKIGIYVDDEHQIDLICDGVLVCTPAGSTAYNLSAHGPILPLTSHMLALTPISCFRPRRWRGALLPSDAKIRFVSMENDKRPVSLSADYQEIRDIQEVEVILDKNINYSLLFDPEHNLEERILREQFLI